MNWEAIALVVVLAISGFVGYEYYSGARACEERGGMPIRGAFVWFKCVDLERK